MTQSASIKLPSNRKFGFFFAALCLIYAAYVHWTGSNSLAYPSAFIGTLFILTAIFAPNSLTRLNKLWMEIGLILGRIISPITLGLIFFGIFTPVSIILKIIGRDELRLKLVQKQSHWITKKNTTFSENFNHQF